MTLRILDYAWHQAHSYRLHALPAEFTFVQFRPRVWDEHQRPIPPNFKGAVQPDAVRGQDYDLALLHLDQWCDSNNLRALPFRLMRQITEGLPRAVIMHGTPDSPVNRLRILRLIGDLPVVCNSVQAAREWDGGEQREDRYGNPQFVTIIHGYAPDEFYNFSLERRRREIATVCSGGAMSREYHGIPLLERLQRDVPLAWYGQSGNRPWKRHYRAYLRTLALSLVYFSPTRRGPLPGARTEAMLSGCCVVSVPGNDVAQYIVSGENGFIVETYAESVVVLRGLLAYPELAYTIGQRGRATATAYFAQARFVADWLTFLTRLGVSAKEEHSVNF
ncbi:MAG: glycosyltransferase [Anaerolineae bacterium]|nr:glycosyltransferase [Anaerolineae bacterium]